MKRWILISVGVVLVAAIVIASVFGGGPKGERVYTEEARVRAIESIVSAPGQIDPKVKVNISAHIVGKIERLYFNEGEEVRRGQKLVDLEKHVYVAQRDRYRAELGSRRVEVQRARAALRTAEAAFQRAQSLSNQGIQAQELFDQARLGLDNAQAGLAAAIQGVQQTEAGLRQAEEDLSRTTIVAPLDGRVVQLNAREGEVVITGTMNNPGSVIAVIADLSQILVEAEVGESEVVALKVGQEARIKVDAIPDHQYRGRVVEIGSSAAVRQGTGGGSRFFRVKVAIDDPDDRLRPGMTSEIGVVTNRAPDSVVIPIQSVVDRVPGVRAGEEPEDRDEATKKYVFLARDGKAHQVEVTTGISDATHVAVLSGVSAGDRVITGPVRILKKINDGDPVNVSDQERASSKEAEAKE